MTQAFWSDLHPSTELPSSLAVYQKKVAETKTHKRWSKCSRNGHGFQNLEKSYENFVQNKKWNVKWNLVNTHIICKHHQYQISLCLWFTWYQEKRGFIEIQRFYCLHLNPYVHRHFLAYDALGRERERRS